MMKPFKKVLQSIDLFPIPFGFSGNEGEKEKQTILGGLISILVGLSSIAYLIYLCYLFFLNKIQPSLSSISVYEDFDFTVNISSEFYSTKILLSNGENLQEYQRKSNTILLHITAYIYSYDEKGNQVVDSTFAEPCKSTDLGGYYCFYFSNFQNGPSLSFWQKNSKQDQIILVFSRCQEQKLVDSQICETDFNIINGLLLSIKTQVFINFNLLQYDTNLKSLIENKRREIFNFDDTISFITQIGLQKSASTIQDGFIFQTSEVLTYISNISRSDMAVSPLTLAQQTLSKPYGGVILQLKPNNILTFIQFPQFTSLLAQFSSVFSTLLVVGFISKMLAESDIFHEMMALHLKVYYKQTALQLIQNGEAGIKKPKEKKSSKKIKENQLDSNLQEIKEEKDDNQNLPKKKKNLKKLCINTKPNEIDFPEHEETNRIPHINEEIICHSIQQQANEGYRKEQPAIFNPEDKREIVLERPISLQINNNFESNQLSYSNKMKLDTNSASNLKNASSQQLQFPGIQLLNSIKQLNIKQLISDNLQIPLFTKFFQALFPKKFSSNKTQFMKIYKEIVRSSSNSLSMFNLQKDLLILKMSVRLLLSPEQYAASHFCGSRVIIQEDNLNLKKESSEERKNMVIKKERGRGDDPFISQNNIAEEKNTPSTLKDNQKLPFLHLNHLEMLDSIDKDEDLLLFYFTRFLESNSQLSKVDERIKNCMIKPQLPKQPPEKLELRTDQEQKSIQLNFV